MVRLSFALNLRTLELGTSPCLLCLLEDFTSTIVSKAISMQQTNFISPALMSSLKCTCVHTNFYLTPSLGTLTDLKT